MPKTREVRTTCTHDCPDACSALVSVDESGRAVEIKADRSHPVTGRHLCIKVDRYLERVYSPDRVTQPLRRIGPKGSGEFEEISWDGALDEIAARWHEIIAASGPEAILPYSYYGSMGMLDGFGTYDALFNRLGATQLERAICGPQVGMLAGLTQWPMADPENLPDAQTVVVWGMDPVSTSIHTWNLIRKARKQNGAKLVVVDPYRSRTAAYADLHLRPHPGTDGALAMAVGHVILRDELYDKDYVTTQTTDVEAYRDAVDVWTPERASAETGVSVSDIEEFAELYASARPAAIRIGVGMQRATGSGSALRAIQCLPALTGQWKWAAGGIHQSVSIGEFNLGALSRPDFVPEGTRSVSMIRLGQVLNDDALDPRVGAIYVWNSNPAAIAANQQLVLKGLARDDLFTVVHDQFLTDTARYADIVLPATTMIEHADLVGSWGFNYLSWNEAAIDPVGESKSNAEVTRLLATKLGLGDEVFKLSDHQLMELAMSESPAEESGVKAARL
ncbi:MAG: molybdopterin-dependent oxidoreductase, partial [Acidimicrobiales bacterium]